RQTSLLVRQGPKAEIELIRLFFFSSRRRHTIFKCDWSSDVCSSDLAVGLGYLNDSGQTRSRFLPDPYSPDSSARLYRTGDLARWRADGTLECFGRVDQQVKVRGCRVELEEIEHALAQHPAVRAAAILARDTRYGDTQLTAYIVAADGQPPAVDDLNGFARSRLPAHMIPA